MLSSHFAILRIETPQVVPIALQHYVNQLFLVRFLAVVITVPVAFSAQADAGFGLVHLSAEDVVNVGGFDQPSLFLAPQAELSVSFSG